MSLGRIEEKRGETHRYGQEKLQLPRMAVTRKTRQRLIIPMT
jgi:hypothetical protein